MEEWAEEDTSDEEEVQEMYWIVMTPFQAKAAAVALAWLIWRASRN